MMSNYPDGMDHSKLDGPCQQCKHDLEQIEAISEQCENLEKLYNAEKNDDKAQAIYDDLNDLWAERKMFIDDVRDCCNFEWEKNNV
jgi:hypothetical protein